LDPVFDQYLRDIRIPTLEYAYRNGELNFRWGNAVEGFNLPIDVNLNGNEVRLQPTTSWQRLKVGSVESLKLAVDPNYYVSSFNLLAE
ncbi:MAG TPA: peptidase M1, partial [Balneolaceae bacterium]|nr:peptidase M1 [Balneolaceae bacterium]